MPTEVRLRAKFKMPKLPNSAAINQQ
uniref:Uncharacterized protein n=1 Tax=Anguilla anguilla TaxID=7936 RepID=A0A0E9S674_ANGAN